MNEKSLEKYNIKPNISGWYNVKKLKEIFKFIYNTDNELHYNPEIDTGDYKEANIDDYKIIIYQTHGENKHNCIIKIKGHTLCTESGDNYYDALTKAIMRLNGYNPVGKWSPSKLHEIIHMTEELNLELSDWYNNQVDG